MLIACIKKLIFIFGVLFLFSIVPVSAQEFSAQEFLDDSVLENRALLLSKKIRCPVCEGQAIDSSDAEIARDLRILVRRQILEGRSDKEILDYIAQRYGDAASFSPRLSGGTLFLWLAPVIFLALSILLSLRWINFPKAKR
jgi:cytochrome c-type biogenesis protein CcmH